MSFSSPIEMNDTDSEDEHIIDLFQDEPIDINIEESKADIS